MILRHFFGKISLTRLYTGATAVYSAIALMVLGFYVFTFSFDGTSLGLPRPKLTPRYHSLTDVRGRTYHTHSSHPVDHQVKANLENINLNNNKEILAHLVARRDILEYKASQNIKSSQFTDVTGEEVNFHLSCNKCALVGSLGSVLDYQNRNLIDSADCVFRMGLAPTTSTFVTHVGTKTTGRILDSVSLFKILKKPQKLVSGTLATSSIVVFDIEKTSDLHKFKERLKVFQKRYPNITVHILSRASELKAWERLRSYGRQLGYSMLSAWPSTLWYSAEVLDAANCSKSYVFGVPPPKFCKVSNSAVSINYWDPYSPKMCVSNEDAGRQTPELKKNPNVPTIDDRRAFQAWSNRRNITFAAPKWD